LQCNTSWMGWVRRIAISQRLEEYSYKFDKSCVNYFSNDLDYPWGSSNWSTEAPLQLIYRRSALLIASSSFATVIPHYVRDHSSLHEDFLRREQTRSSFLIGFAVGRGFILPKIGNFCFALGRWNPRFLAWAKKTCCKRKDLPTAGNWLSIHRLKPIFLAPLWFQDAGIKVLEWPVQSLDLSSIEHLWVHLKNLLTSQFLGHQGAQEER